MSKLARTKSARIRFLPLLAVWGQNHEQTSPLKVILAVIFTADNALRAPSYGVSVGLLSESGNGSGGSLFLIFLKTLDKDLRLLNQKIDRKKPTQ